MHLGIGVLTMYDVLNGSVPRDTLESRLLKM